MSETAIYIVFILIVLGQIYFLNKNILSGVLYYICVSPLYYFSIWFFFTLSLDKVCGLILIIFYLFEGKRFKKIKVNKIILLLFFYGVFITIINYSSLPFENIKGRSIFYSQLRSVVQLFNWTLMFLTAYIIGIVFLSTPRILEKLKVVVYFSLTMSIYAFYQVFAYYLDLPFTGIRRPYSDIVGSTEQFAMEKIAGITVYRTNAFIGEPKSFASFLLFPIIFGLTYYLFVKKNRKIFWITIINISAFLLTLSTSAYVSFLFFSIILILYVLLKQANLVYKTLVPFIFVATIFIILFTYGNLSINFDEIIRERMYNRLTVEKSIGDLAEMEAIQIILQNNSILFFGYGLGNISFLIAAKIGIYDVVYSVNNGVIQTVSDIGLVGLLLYLIIFLGRFKELFAKKLNAEKIVLNLIIVVLLFQHFIFPQSWSFSFVLALYIYTTHIYVRHKRLVQKNSS